MIHHWIDLERTYFESIIINLLFAFFQQHTHLLWTLYTKTASSGSNLRNNDQKHEQMEKKYLRK